MNRAQAMLICDCT